MKRRGAPADEMGSESVNDRVVDNASFRCRVHGLDRFPEFFEYGLNLFQSQITHLQHDSDFPGNDALTTPDRHLELWRSACSGDRTALEQLLRGMQDIIFRFCLSQTRDEHIAIEVTQETAIRMIEKLDQFSGTGKLTTWVLGIANNVCRETRRR